MNSYKLTPLYAALLAASLPMQALRRAAGLDADPEERRMLLKFSRMDNKCTVNSSANPEYQSFVL